MSLKREIIICFTKFFQSLHTTRCSWKCVWLNCIPLSAGSFPLFVGRLHVFLCVHTDFLGLPMCWFPSIVWRLKNRLEVCSRACSSAYVLSPDERSSPRFHQPQHGSATWMKGTTLWAIRLTPTGVFKCSPPSVWWSRKREAIASSILHQAGCCVSFHLLPAKICDVPPSITTDSHLAGCFCSSCATVCPEKKKKKDVRGSSTRVNNYEACSVCVWVWISFTERAFHIVARTLYFQTPAVHKRFRGRGSEVKPPRACSDTTML